MIIANVTPIKSSYQSYSGAYTSSTPGLTLSCNFWYDEDHYDEYFTNYFEGTRFIDGNWEPKIEKDKRKSKNEVKPISLDKYSKFNLDPGDMKIIRYKLNESPIRVIDLEEPSTKKFKLKFTPPSKYYFDFCKGLGD